MTIVALIAGATFLGMGFAAHKLGPDRMPEQNDLDFD